MFKLVKIKDSRTNVPEPEIFETSGVDEFIPGLVYYITKTGISMNSSGDDNTKIIPLEYIPADSGIKRLRGYIVTEDMVFETDIYGDTSGVKVGKRVCGYVDAETRLIGVDAYEGTEAMILNTTSMKDERKVLVALKF